MNNCDDDAIVGWVTSSMVWWPKAMSEAELVPLRRTEGPACATEPIRLGLRGKRKPQQLHKPHQTRQSGT